MVLPSAIFFAFMTVIGIPFAIFGLGVFAALVLYAAAYLPIIAGSLVLHRWRPRPAVDWLTIVVGVLALMVVNAIPFVGWLVSLVLFWVALGIVGNDMKSRFWD